MFQRITPEQAGLPSASAEAFVRALERRGLVMHSVLLMKGTDIFAEGYWSPFREDLCHRMYSQTKSFVGVAIGLLEEDGKLRLDDRICTYFPDKLTRELPVYLQELTIRQMLTMRTCGGAPGWFLSPETDRTRLYFAENRADHPAGTQWKYDSAGSQVLSALVERLAGKSLLAFLDERIFRHLGTFRTAEILKTKNDDSWGDSALLCTTRDMASFARFVMNGGVWEGKRLMNEGYLRQAVSCLADNDREGFDGAFTQGYGYLIWKVPGGFAFNGMGGQLTLCLPQQDLIFSCTGDNQGFAAAKDLILSAFYEYIADPMQASPLPEDPSAFARYRALEEGLTLSCLRGPTASPMAGLLNGKTFICEENPMGIREFSLSFGPDGTGVWRYVNAQGGKQLPFGLGKNVFGKFPQTGYSGLHGGLPDEHGCLYDCAVSAAWRQEDKLALKVQIIDRYLGNLYVVFSFREDLAFVTMTKHAEQFLNEYSGQLLARMEV